MLPDSSRAGTNFTPQRVPVSTLRQIRRAAAFEHEAVASKLTAKDAD